MFAKLLLSISFLSALYFIVSLFFIHNFRRDLNLFYHGLSNYALGKKGGVIKLSFFFMGLSEILVGLVISGEQNVKFAGYFLILAGLGILIVFAFPAAYNDPLDLHKCIHYFGSIMQSIFFIVSLFILSFYFFEGGLKVYTLATLIVGIILSLSLMVFYFFFSRTRYDGFVPYGLIQKLGLLVLNFWVIVISANLIWRL